MDKLRVLTLSGFVLMMIALYMIFIYVPTEANMGVVQRIFYFHVPLAWLAFLAFFIVFICSIFYLVKRNSKLDRVASSSAEVGVIFTTLFLISGSIWAKPIWGVWWTWEPRLTAALVLWLIYIAYLLVRSYVSNKEQGSRFAAVVGIVGFVDVPIVALAITLWRTEHPSPIIFEGGLAPSMLYTLLVSIAAFSVLFAILLLQKVSNKDIESDIKIIKQGITDTFPEELPEKSNQKLH
jgi:heme exporter protein C